MGLLYYQIILINVTPFIIIVNAESQRHEQSVIDVAAAVAFGIVLALLVPVCVVITVYGKYNIHNNKLL